MRKIITWSTRSWHPWLVIAVWVLIAGGLAAGPSLQSVTTNDASKGLPASVESKRADALQQREFPQSRGTPVIVVFSSDKPLTQEQKSAVDDAQAWLTASGQPITTSRVEYSSDGKAALLFASLKGTPGDQGFRDTVSQMRDHFGDSVAGMQVRVTGPGGLITDVFEIFLNADLKLLLGTVVLVLVLLLLIYRSPILPFVPLLAVGIGYMVAGSLLAIGAKAAGVTLSGQATSLMVILLFGAGTDYGLLLISRYREELRREPQHRVALATALTESWEAIAASGLTVTLAVLTLLLARYGEYRAFAPVLGLGVFITLIAALTLMPALLALLGRRAFWPRVPKAGDVIEHRRWEGIARFVARGPRRAALGVIAILGVLALGALFYAPRFSFTEDFLKDMPSKQGYALLEQHFPRGALAPTTVLVRVPQTEAMPTVPSTSGSGSATPSPIPSASSTPMPGTGMGGLSQGFIGKVEGILSENPAVAAAFPTGVSANGKWSAFQVILKGDPYSTEALDQIDAMRDDLRAAVGEDNVLVGGPTATQADTWAISNRDTIVVAVAALVVVAVILALLLRAIVAPAYLLATNVLSYLAALGATILITEKLLGWQHISYRIPLYMFIFLVALGSDYNIFITTRIRAEAMAHGLHDGIIRALTRTGGVLTSAGIILAGTFLILLSEPVKDLVEISIGVAIGVLIDTFLVRTALVPGLTLWIGPTAGWPGKRWEPAADDEDRLAPAHEPNAQEPAAQETGPAPSEA